MTDTITRLVVKDAQICGHVGGELAITGYVVRSEPELPVNDPSRFLLPLFADAPDSEIEIGYSKNALEPLTLVFRDRKVNLTKTLYVLFRYVYDLYRSEGQTEFDFAELSEVLKGDDLEMRSTAIGHTIRRLAEHLEKIRSPILLTYRKERLYVRESAQGRLDLAAGEDKANVRGKATHRNIRTLRRVQKAVE